MNIIFIILIIVLMPHNSSAEEIGLTEEFSSCVDKAAGVTASMIDCISMESKIQDERLNKAYKEVSSQLSPSRKKELQSVQRDWLKYRDANCNFYYDPDGGTIARVRANDCFMSATALRASEIEGFKGQD